MNDNLEIPDFKPDLPEYILKDLAPSERYTLENLSVVRQYMGWQNTVLKETCDLARKTNGRVTALEKGAVETNADLSEIKENHKVLKPLVKTVLFCKSKIGFTVTASVVFLVAFIIYPYLLTLGEAKLLSLFFSLFS